MQQSILEMAKDLVKALIEAGQLTPDAMPQALQDMYACLMALQARANAIEAGESVATGRLPIAMDWRQSIARHAITCLECGTVCKQLSIRHLREHNLNARSYRAKYGIPSTQPLAARETTARRRQAMQEIRPWEKSPRYIRAQAGRTVKAKKNAGAKRKRR